MGDMFRDSYRKSDLRAKRSPSKVVSEAFSFLNSKSYPDQDGVVRIHSSYSDSRLAYMDQPGSLDVDLQPDVYIPEEAEEFTIVTSVEKSPQRQNHRLSENPDSSSQSVFNENKDHVNVRRESLPNMFIAESAVSNGIPPMNSVDQSEGETSVAKIDTKKEEFTIVTYLEDHNKVKNNVSQSTKSARVSEEEKTAEMKTNLEVNENRRSVNIDGEIVELRSPAKSSTPVRAPTWKQNQKLVSEAFDFLRDLEGGDTISVISVPADDKNSTENTVGNEMETNKNNYMTGSTKTQNSIKSQVQKPACENQDAKLNSFGKPSSSSLVSSEAENRVLSDPDCSSVMLDRLSTSTEKDDQLGELQGMSKLRQRRRSPRKETEDEDDADSSDEDRGVYRESFRKSTWLYVGDSSDVSGKGGSSKESGYISLADIKGCDNDSVFDDDQESLPSNSPTAKKSHERTDSVATTASEREFRNAYSGISKRLVKRADSQQEYKRFSSKFYDHEKVFTIEKDGSSGYGIHIIDSRPAVITQVDEGSPGARAGVKEGQIVISINSVNVLDYDHDDIIKLVQENSKQLLLEVGCSDVAHIRDLEIPIMTGYLMKQTSALLFKSWKRRYFILRRDNCLYYYKTEKDADPLGAIPLTGYTVSRHGDLSKFGFKAEKFDHRTYFFMADIRDDMAKWVGAMNEAALRSRHKKDAWLDVTTNNVELPALEIRKPDCSGYLFKLGRVTKRWRKNYCVLKDACIYHYKNSSSKEAIGVAHLHGYTVDPDGVSGKKYSFSLQPPDEQMRAFSFYTDNETDKTRWVKALQTSIQKWVKVG